MGAPSPMPAHTYAPPPHAGVGYSSVTPGIGAYRGSECMTLQDPGYGLPRTILTDDPVNSYPPKILRHNDGREDGVSGDAAAVGVPTFVSAPEGLTRASGGLSGDAGASSSGMRWRSCWKSVSCRRRSSVRASLSWSSWRSRYRARSRSSSTSSRPVSRPAGCLASCPPGCPRVPVLRYTQTRPSRSRSAPSVPLATRFLTAPSEMPSREAASCTVTRSVGSMTRRVQDGGQDGGQGIEDGENAR